MDLSTNPEPLKYNPFRDKYLESYFKSPTLQNHLRSIGLIAKDGREITEEEFKRAAIRRQQRWAARQQLAQRAVLQNRDFQMGRQLELRRQLDAVEKVEIYRKVKGNSGHELVQIQPLDLERSLNRSHSAPGLKSFRRSSLPMSTTSPEQLLQSSGYQTDDDRPKSMPPRSQESTRSSRERSLRRRYLSDQYRFQYLHKLDSGSLENYEDHLRRQLMQIEKYRRQIQNYYSFDERLGMIPSMSNSPSSSGFRGRSMSSGSSAKWSHLRFGQTNKRARSTSPPDKKIAKQRQIFITSAAARKRRQLQPSCECFLQYLGHSKFNDENEKESNISISQQHSGGNNIVVFKEDLTPKAKFQFVSYRQKGFPFTLAISDENQIVQKISTCCESRYTVGNKLGGKQGVFKWLGVKNAVPCYKCQMHRGLEAPYTNFGQKKKKLKLVKKKSSEDEGLEKDNEGNHEATTDSEKELQTVKPSSAKPPRPHSARSKTRGSISSTAGLGIIAAGAIGGIAVGSTLAVIDDQDEGLHSKVPSEHGSSLKASSDDDLSDKEDKRSTGGDKDEIAKNEDDFFDDNQTSNVENAEEKDTEQITRRSSSASSSSSEGSESETEEQKSPETSTVGKWGLEKENSLENKQISKEQNDDEEQRISNIEENSAENDETTENSNSEDQTTSADKENDNQDPKIESNEQENEEETHSETETESGSESFTQSGTKSRKSSTASEGKSRKSSMQSENKRRKDSMASGWGDPATDEEDEQEREPTIKEEEENVDKPEPATAEDDPAVEQQSVPATEPTQEQKQETAEHTASESESESGSSFSDSDSEEDGSVSKTVDGGQNDDKNFAEKLKEAGSALIGNDGEPTENVGETVVLVDVHKNNNVNDDQKTLTPWICSVCSFDNDSDENVCRICGESKDAEPKNNDEVQNTDNEDANDKEETNDNEQDVPQVESNDDNVLSGDNKNEEPIDNGTSDMNNDLTYKETDDPIDNNPNDSNLNQDDRPWSCKFCATSNESDANNCQTCLLPKEYTKPTTPNPNSLSTGSALTSDDNNVNSKSVESDEIHDHNTAGSEELHDEDAAANEEVNDQDITEQHEEENVSKHDEPNQFIDEGRSVTDVGDPEQVASRKSSATKSYNSEPDRDTLADARSIKSHPPDENHLIPPSIEIQAPSPSFSGEVNVGKVPETPRSQKIAAEIKDIDIDQAKSYLREFSAEVLHSADPQTEVDVGAAIGETVEQPQPVPQTDGLPENLIEDLIKPEAVVNNVDLSPAEVEKVAEILSKNENLNSLTIKSAKFTDDHLFIIANAIRNSNAQLRVINLNVNLLTSSSIQSIIELMKNKPVEILSLHDNQINDEGIEELIFSLIAFQKQDQSIKLRRLDIGENDITTKPIGLLSNYVAENDQLQCLTLSGLSQITEDGWQSMANGLSINDSLQAVMLDYCQLGDANMETICNSLKNKTNLKTLDIEGNNLSDKGVSAVVELVRSCPNIKNVQWMAGNNISSDNLKRVEQIINGRQNPNEKDHLSLSAKSFIK